MLRSNIRNIKTLLSKIKQRYFSKSRELCIYGKNTATHNRLYSCIWTKVFQEASVVAERHDSLHRAKHPCSEPRSRRSRVRHHMHAPHCQQHFRRVTRWCVWIRGHYSFKNLLPLPKFAQLPHLVPWSHVGHSPQCGELRFKLRVCVTTKGDPQQFHSGRGRQFVLLCMSKEPLPLRTEMCCRLSPSVG